MLSVPSAIYLLKLWHYKGGKWGSKRWGGSAEAPKLRWSCGQTGMPLSAQFNHEAMGSCIR
eukprot:3099776-Amphidinium_carterae.1